MKKVRVDPYLSRIAKQKLIDSGYTNIRDFTRRSGVPFTVETTRRLFSGDAEKGMSAITIAIILKYLGSPKVEIAELLSQYTDDREVISFLSETVLDDLSPAKRSLIEVVEKIHQKGISFEFFLESLALQDRMLNLGVEKHIARIRKFQG